MRKCYYFLYLITIKVQVFVRSNNQPIMTASTVHIDVKSNTTTLDVLDNNTEYPSPLPLDPTFSEQSETMSNVTSTDFESMQEVDEESVQYLKVVDSQTRSKQNNPNSTTITEEIKSDCGSYSTMIDNQEALRLPPLTEFNLGQTNQSDDDREKIITHLTMPIDLNSTYAPLHIITF